MRLRRTARRNKRQRKGEENPCRCCTAGKPLCLNLPAPFRESRSSSHTIQRVRLEGSARDPRDAAAAASSGEGADDASTKRGSEEIRPATSFSFIVMCPLHSVSTQWNGIVYFVFFFVFFFLLPCHSARALCSFPLILPRSASREGRRGRNVEWIPVTSLPFTAGQGGSGGGGGGQLPTIRDHSNMLPVFHTGFHSGAFQLLLFCSLVVSRQKKMCVM